MPTANVTMTVREATPTVRVIDITGEITGFSEKEISAAHDEASAGRSGTPSSSTSRVSST